MTVQKLVKLLSKDPDFGIGRVSNQPVFVCRGLSVVNGSTAAAAAAIAAAGGSEEAAHAHSHRRALKLSVNPGDADPTDTSQVARVVDASGLAHSLHAYCPAHACPI